MTISFPTSLEIEVPATLPFQFELENIPQVVFLLEAIEGDAAAAKFSCYINKDLVWTEQIPAKAGETISITLHDDLLVKLNTALETSPAETPNDAAPAQADEENNGKKSTSEPRNGKRRGYVPIHKFIGKAVHPVRDQPSVPMQWMSKGAEHNVQGQTYRQLITELCYPNTRPFKNDPLHVWSFFLTTNNVAVSVMPIDTRLEQYNTPEGLEKLKQKIYRRLYSLAHYEEHLDKFVKEDAQRLAAENATATYIVKPIPDQPGKSALAAWHKLPVNKLLRIAIPTDTPESFTLLIRGSISYANHLGIDLLFDRFD